MRILKAHWQLILLTGLVFAAWRTPVAVPLKVLVVFFHELAHVVAVLATGGAVETLSVSPDQGGAVTSVGGSRFWILSAGYIGSLLIGAGLFAAAVRSRVDRIVLGLLGAVMVVVAVLYIREGFAFLFCTGVGAAMLLAAKFLPHAVNDLVLRVIGLTSIIYVPFDIFDDTIARSVLPSDARMLAQEIGGPTVLWGGIWLAVSLIVIIVCLRVALSGGSNISLREWRSG